VRINLPACLIAKIGGQWGVTGISKPRIWFVHSR
jgi:hypothetical protein